MTEKYRQIILHVGMHKTGTTSIQNNCFRHQVTLAEHGIIYPFFRHLGKTKANHSGLISAAISKNPDRYGEQWRTGFDDSPETLQIAFHSKLMEILIKPQGHTLILSGETISAFAEDDLKTLQKLLLEHTECLKVVVYIRNPSNAVGSILQQRVRDGGDSDTDDSIIALASLSKHRYRRLKNVFQKSLEVINFHEAANHPNGLVGSFMEFCGLPAAKTAKLEHATANTRISMEAFKLMLAINKVYPAMPDEGAPRQREFNDLRSLALLPGQPFAIEYLNSKALQHAIDSETQWLATQLNLTFPKTIEVEEGALWSTAVLCATEAAIRGLESEQHRVVAADFLVEESAHITPNNPRAATILAFIAHKIKTVKTDPAPFILQSLGADYFKNSAFAVENHSPKLALELMRLAQCLRPEGIGVNKRILKYQEKLKD